jgi:hypothetical protein
MSTALKLARIIGALAALALICACSTVKLGYNNLEEVAYWWLDGYVDLTGEQRPRVREELARLHAWHRATELPRYADLLHRVATLAAGDVTPAQACGVIAEIRGRLEVLATHATPAIATIAQGLEPAQLQHLERKYRRNNAAWRDDWIELAPAELARKRFKQMLDRSETVYGGLHEPQRAALRKQLDTSAFDARRILSERERRQQDALQTLRRIAGQRTPPAEARMLVQGYLDRALHSPDAAGRAYQEDLIEENCHTIAAVHNSATAAQREVAVRRLRAWQRDVRELAAPR